MEDVEPQFFRIFCPENRATYQLIKKGIDDIKNGRELSLLVHILNIVGTNLKETKRELPGGCQKNNDKEKKAP